MFTAIAKSLLVKHASPFIEVEGLDLNIEKGNIHLENVRLKETALAALDLPIDVTFGIVKRVVIKIPWTQLTTKPTIVMIDGIYALIRNRTDFSGDEVERQKLARGLHLRSIDAYEKSLAEDEERDKEFEKNDGKKKQDGADAVISSKFLMSIVDNLQVTIKNLHLRYVDETSFIGHRCAIGFAIREIVVYPFDRKHKRKYDPANAKAFRAAVVEFYKELAPQKTEEHIDHILRKWDKKEDVLFDQLEARYGRRPKFELETTSQENSRSKSSSTGPDGKKKPKFLLKKFEINDVFLYIDPDVEESALRFDNWDKPDVICGIMSAVFDPVKAAARAKEAGSGSGGGGGPVKGALRGSVETAISQRVGWVKPSSHMLLPLSLSVGFKSYQSTANRDLPLFELSVGGESGGMNTGGEDSTVALRVSPGQFGALAAIADSLTNYRKFSRLRSRRPKSTRPNNDPRGWWQYVIHAVIVQVRDHLGSRSWTRLIELLRVREQYIELYKAKLKHKGHKNSAIDRALSQLDTTLPIAQAKYFRTVVRRDRKKQRLMKVVARKEKKALGNWFERKFATKEMRQKLELNKKQLRAAQAEWEKMQEQIDASYVEVTPWDQMHAEDIIATVDVHLNVSVDLVSDSGEALLGVAVQGVEVYIKAMAAFQEVHVAISDLEIRDECTKGTHFPYVMTKTRAPGSASASEADNHLLTVDILMPPKDKECDVKIDVVGRPLDITLSPSFLLGLVDRFNVSQPLNLEALQDMLLESIGLLRRRTDQDVLTRSKQAQQKEAPTLNLNVNLQIGTVNIPEDLCDLTKSILAVNLGQVEVSIDGHKLQKLRDDSPDAENPDAEFKYMPINVSVRNFSARLLPETCSEPLVKPTDVFVSVLVSDPLEQLPSTMPNVKIAVATAPIILGLNGSTFNRLLQTIATTVLIIPTENLVPPDEKALVDSMRESGFDLFFERDTTQARLRQRMHDQSVKFVEFDERVLSVLQEKVMMTMDLNIPSVEVVCWREEPDIASPPASGRRDDESTKTPASSGPEEMLRLHVDGFKMKLRTQLYDTQVDMEINDIVAVASNQLPDGSVRQLELLSFAGLDKSTGKRDSPVFVLDVKAAKPLSAEFAAMRGTSEVNLTFAHYLHLNVTRPVLVDLLQFFVLNIPFDALQQMEVKTKEAKAMLFDPAEVLRRNRANNGGIEMCRESLQRSPGHFDHFFGLSRVDMSIHGVVVRALLDDCSTGLLEARVRNVVFGMCRETQAMEINARILGLALVDLTEAGEASPTVLRAGDVHGRPQSPGVVRPGRSETLDVTTQPFVDIAVWMFDPFKGSPPDLYVKGTVQTIVLTVLNRFLMGVVGYAADKRLQVLLGDIEERTPKPEKFVAVDHATGEPIPPRVILPDVDVTLHGISITIPTYTGADTYAIMGINGIVIKNVPPPNAGHSSSEPISPGSAPAKKYKIGERTEIKVGVLGMYLQLRCEGMRRVVDFLRIESVGVNFLMLGQDLTCGVAVSPLEVCFSVQHFSALLGLLNNIKEQPQISMSDQEMQLLQEGIAKAAVKKRAGATNGDSDDEDAPASPGELADAIPTPAPHTAAAAPDFPFDKILANIKFDGIRCQLLKDLPMELDVDSDAKATRISLFTIADQPEKVLAAVKRETVSVLEMGPLNVDAKVTGGGTAINASIALEYFKVLDRRPQTLEHYRRLAAPASNRHSVQTGDGDDVDAASTLSSNYTASLQAFGTIVHLEGTKETPFLHVQADVKMDTDEPSRLRAVKLTGGLSHIHVTYSDLIMQVMTIFEPPELPPVPEHVAALFQKSTEAAAAAAAAAAESASQALNDDFMADLLRGAIEIEVGLSVASGGIHILFSEEQGEENTAPASSDNTYMSENVPAGFLLQWDGIHLKVGVRGVRHVVIRTGVDGIRLGVRQVGLSLEDLNVPQQSRDIIPAFSVAVGIGTKVPKPRRKSLEELEAVNVVDDLRALQLSLRVTVTRIKVFVSSYIAMKAARMITAAQKLFGPDLDSETTAPKLAAPTTHSGRDRRTQPAGPSAEGNTMHEDSSSSKDVDAESEDLDAYKSQAVAVAEAVATTTKAIKSKGTATGAAAAAGGTLALVDTAAAIESTALQRGRSIGLSLFGIDMRVQLAGVDVFIAADLPTTNFGLSFHVNDIIVSAEVAKGRSAVELDLTLSSQFQQALSQPFIETTKMHANVKFSCSGLVPPALLAYQFEGPQQLRSFLDKSIPLELDFLTEETLNINIRQNMVSVAIHCIDSVVAFLEDVDASVDQANQVSTTEKLRQWEREKVTLNVQTLRNDTGLPLHARFSMAWNNGGVDTTWPSISIPTWRVLEPNETMVVELPFYVYEKMVDQTLEVQFPKSELLADMGHSGKEVFSFSSYDLRTFTSSRSAHVLPLHGSHNYTILSSKITCDSGMDLGMELRPVRRDVVKMILLNLRPGTLSKNSRLYSVVMSDSSYGSDAAAAQSAGRNFAQMAALRPGDYLFQIDGQFLPSSSSFANVFQEHVQSRRPLRMDIIRQSQRVRRDGESRFSDVKLVFEKQRGGSMMSLRSELSIRNDLTVPVQLQFFLLHDARQGVWNHFEQFDTTVAPDSEFAVPLEIVLNNMCYVRTRPVISNCSMELPFSPLYRVQALCHRRLDPTEFGPSIEQVESGFIPQQPTGGAASAQSMTPRAAEEAALVDQAGVSFEVATLEMFHCILDVRHDAVGTPQLSVVPPFRAQNLLPTEVEIVIQVIEGQDSSFKPVRLAPTEKVSICNADRRQRATFALMARLVGCPHLSKWSDPLNKMSRLKHDEGTIIVEDTEGNHLRLQFAAVNSVTTSKFYDLCVFAPFWVVNCTGYPFLYSAQGGNIAGTAQPGRRNGVKIKARNNTAVPGIIDSLLKNTSAKTKRAAAAVVGVAEHEQGEENKPKLQTQCTLTFLSDAVMSRKKLGVRMKLEGTDEAWTPFFDMGNEGGAVDITVPCTKKHLAVSVNNVPLPTMFSRSKLIFLQPRYVMYNNTDHRLWIRQVMSIRNARKDAAESIHAAEHSVDAHSQVPFYFRDEMFGFVQFKSEGAPSSWSGAIDIQALGYNEIRLGGGSGGDDESLLSAGSTSPGGSGGGASPSALTKRAERDATLYHQVEVFETRSIIYVKLTELAPMNVYTRVSNTCLNEYVQLEQVLVEKESSKHVNPHCPTTVEVPSDELNNIFIPHSEIPYVVDHPTLPPVVNVIIHEPSRDAGATGFLRRVGSVRVDLRACSKLATDFSIMVPGEKSISGSDHHVIVRLQLVDGITKLHVFRVRADDSNNVMSIPTYLKELDAIANDTRRATPLPPRAVRNFDAHKAFLRDFLKSSRADRMLRQYSGNDAPPTRRVQSKIVLQVKGVGISIIADHPSDTKSQSYELLYICLSDLFLWHEQDNQKMMTIEAHIGAFQIDSAAQGTSYPVLLYQYKHVRAEQEAERKGSPQYFLAVNIVSEHHDAIDYYDYINVLMQAVVLKFDTPFLNEVLQLVAEVSAEVEALGKNDHLQKQELKNTLVKHTELAPNVVNTNRRVYIQKLLLQPIKLTLCYTPVGRYKEYGQVTGAVRRVLNFFGGFAKIDADITLQSYIAESVADNSNMFANAVQKHYLNKLLLQVYRVVFGLQTLGNPMKLFSNLGTGVKQLYYEPSQGAVLGTKEFMTGLGRGTMDFLGGVTMGVTGLASAGLETVASAVEQLSFNKDYIAGRQAHRARAPKNALHGLGKAGKGVALGIGRGLAGIFVDPVKGAQQGAKQSAGHAIGGFFKGVGQGLMGVVVKPAAAIVSGTATVMDGINQNVSLDTVARHVRLPRFLQNNIICDYSDREGLANILVQAMREHIADTTLGIYIYHMLCDHSGANGKDKHSKHKSFLLMTSEFVVHGTLALAADRDYSDRHHFELKWKIAMENVESIAVEGKNVEVVLTARAASSPTTHKATRVATRRASSGSSSSSSSGSSSTSVGSDSSDGTVLALHAAYSHDALIFLRLFLRLRDEFQASARFAHQIRVWLSGVDRKLPGKQRESMAKRDPLVTAYLESRGAKHSRSSVTLAAFAEGGSAAEAAASGSGAAASFDEPVSPGLQEEALEGLMNTNHFILRSAYASGVERRTKATTKFFSKGMKQYYVVKLAVEGMTLGSTNQTVFLELTKTYKDFKDLRHSLRHTRNKDEEGVWGAETEAIWKRVGRDVQENDLHYFEQLIRSIVGTGVLGSPSHKIPSLWAFFTEDFHLVGGTGM